MSKMSNTAALRPGAQALWHREITRFFRQRTRVIGAFLTPVIFWGMLGLGLDNALRIDTSGGRVGYMAYFFPGALGLIVLFTAIFATISVIEDREAGFLQSVLASPAPRVSIVLGKVLGGATLALIQAALFLIAWPFVAGVGDWQHWVGIVVVLPVVAWVACVLTGLGLLLAWRCTSVAGFHALMNLILMPMWFLSGAVFPLSTVPPAMRWVMLANPMTHAQAMIAHVLGAGDDWLNPWIACLVFMGWTVLILQAAVRTVAQPSVRLAAAT